MDFFDEQDFSYGVAAMEVGSPYCTVFDAYNSCVPAPGETKCTDADDEEVAAGAPLARWTLGVSLTDIESRRRAVCTQVHEDWRTQPDIVCVEELVPGGCTAEWVSQPLLNACLSDPFCDGADLNLVTFLDPELVPAADRGLPMPVAYEVGVELTWQDAPGVFGPGGAYDPVAGVAWWYGGTSGGCQDWFGVGGCGETFPDGADHAGSLHAFNLQGFLEIDTWYGSHQRSLAEPWDADREAVLGEAPTVGVRGAGLVPLGRVWDVGTRSWTSENPRWRLVGGTLHQDVEPLVAHVLDNGLDLTPTQIRFEEMGADEPDPGVWWVEPLRGLGGVGLSEGAVPEEVPTSLAPGHDRAVVAVGPDHFLTVGGDVQGGEHELMVWGDAMAPEPIADEAGVVRNHFPVGGGGGLAAAYDPVTQSAYVFGVFGTDPEARGPVQPDLVRVQPSTAPVVAHHLLPTEVDTRLRILDPMSATPETESWEVHHVSEFLVDCDNAVTGAGGCRMDTISVKLAPGFVASSMEVLIGGVRHELIEAGRTRFANADLVVLKTPMLAGTLDAAVSPRFLLEVHGTLPPAAQASGWWEKHPTPTWLGYGSSGSCGAAAGMSWDGLPVHLDSEGYDAVLNRSPLHTIEVIGPTGFEVVAPWFDRVCEPTVMNCCQNALDVTSERRTCLRPDHDGTVVSLQTERFSFELRPDTDPPVHRAPSAGPAANVWIDRCLDPAVRAAVDEWVSGDSGPWARSYDGAASWLDARLGSAEAKGTETPLAVWIGRDEARSEGGVVVPGYTKGGLVVLRPFGPDGGQTANEPVASSLRRLDGTATHELAHVLMSRRKFMETEWFSEAVPTVLSMQRVPGFQPHTLYDGLARRVSAFTSSTEGVEEIQNLSLLTESRDDPVQVRVAWVRGFMVGPYLLAQNLALRDAADSLAAWNTLRDTILASGIAHRPADLPELAGWLDQPGSPTAGFTEARVQGGVRGEPLLGLHILDHPAAGDVLAEVVQVQTSLVAADGTPFPVFDAVPYAIGCASDADGAPLSGGPPFLECDLGGIGVISAGHVLTTASAALTFTPQAATDTSGAWFALLAGPQLLPEVTGLYGLLDGTSPPVPYERWPDARPTWWASCTAGSSLVGCQAPDADADGFRRYGDCADTDPMTHPGAADPVVPYETWSVTSPDRDCDGWPGPWLFIDPTAAVPEVP